MGLESILKSDQEQAVAAWVSYLNQMRIDNMLSKLHDEFREQEIDLGRASREMSKALRDINDVIMRNDGGQKGIHGNIAEVAEAGVRNARCRMETGIAPYVRLYDFSEDDLQRGAQFFQLKFSQSGGSFSLDAVRKHFLKYPHYISDGKKYIIPKDHYETVKRLYFMSEKEATRLTKASGGPSYKDWKRVQDFFSETGVTINDIEPSAFDYSEVKRDTIHSTLRREKASQKATHDERHERTRSEALKIGSPSLQEGLKASGSAAAIEGGFTFVMAITAKLKDGKRLYDLDGDDWAEIAAESGKDVAKGGVRGAAVYFLTNFNVSGYVAETYSLASHEFIAKSTENYISISGAAASALVTASFSVAEQAHLLRIGAIDEAEFLERSEILCLDASVSAISSFIGQAVIPVPVLGAVIGNTVGTMLYQIAKDNLNEQEAAILKAYAEEQRRLNETLSSEYQSLIAELNEGISCYLLLLDRALAPDPFEAFEGSIELARFVGVPEDELLTTMDEIDDYFLL